MPRFDPQQRNIVSTACICHFLAHYATGLYPPLIELLRADLGLNFAIAANIALPGYFLFGAASLPLGILASRMTARYLLAGGNVLIGIAAIGAALATSPWMMLVSLAGIGLGASVYHPVGYTLIAKAISHRGRAHGMQGVFGNIGIATAPLLGGLIAFWASWRWSYAILAVVALAGAAFTLSVPFREDPVAPSSHHQQDVGVSRKARLVLLGLLITSATLYGFVFRGWELLLPKHIGETLFAGGDTGQANLASTNLGGTIITGCALIVASLGQAFGGRLADRVHLVRAYLMFHLLSLPFLVGIALLKSFWTLPLSTALFSFFNLGMQPLENSLFARYASPRWRGFSYGLKFVVVFGVGSLAVSYVGPITERYGTQTAYLGLVPFTVGVILCGVTLNVVEKLATAPQNNQRDQ